MDTVDGVLFVYLVHSRLFVFPDWYTRASSFFFLQIPSSSLNRRERERSLNFAEEAAQQNMITKSTSTSAQYVALHGLIVFIDRSLFLIG